MLIYRTVHEALILLAATMISYTKQSSCGAPSFSFAFVLCQGKVIIGEIKFPLADVHITVIDKTCSTEVTVPTFLFLRLTGILPHFV
jgi:hypothetical protein